MCTGKPLAAEHGCRTCACAALLAVLNLVKGGNTRGALSRGGWGDGMADGVRWPLLDCKLPKRVQLEQVGNDDLPCTVGQG